MQIKFELGIALLLAAGVAVLSGCANQTIPDGAKDLATDGSYPDPPSFTSAYKDDYLQAWIESDSDYVREVIKDEVVTDAEWAETVDRLESCFSDHGVGFSGFDSMGGYSVSNGSLSSDEVKDLLPVCENDSGEAWLNFFRFSAASNPDNRPVEEVITECLIRNEVLLPTYTPEQYLVDVPDMSFPFADEARGKQVLQACSEDPFS